MGMTSHHSVQGDECALVQNLQINPKTKSKVFVKMLAVKRILASYKA